MKYDTTFPPNLTLSLTMVLAYGGLVAAFAGLHSSSPSQTPAGTAPSPSVAGPPAASASMPLSTIASPGNLRLRMTLPYVPSTTTREAEQEI